MNTQLLAIRAEDLLLLSSQAQNEQDIAQASGIQAKLDLQHRAPILEILLTQAQLIATSCLHYALVAQFPFRNVQQPDLSAHYNLVHQVAEISQALDEISIEQFQRCYHPQYLQQAKLLSEAWGQAPEQEQAGLVLSFTQLQNFYRVSFEQHYAVVSLHNQNTSPAICC